MLFTDANQCAGVSCRAMGDAAAFQSGRGELECHQAIAQRDGNIYGQEVPKSAILAQ